MKNKSLKLIVVLAGLLAGMPLAAQERLTATDRAMISQARQLMSAGQAAQALALLMPLEDRLAGDPVYDYTLGLAALEGGDPSEALFALRRVVVTRPANAGARLDLARTYYAIGDNESAGEEFRQLRAMNPPPATAAVIDRYLRAIGRRSGLYATRVSGFAAFDAGSDSNANNATDIRQFEGFMLQEQSRATSSGFAGLVGGVNLSQPLAPRWRLVADANAFWREYPDASFVSRLQYGGGAGAGYQRKRWGFLARASMQTARIDDSENSDVVNLDFGGNLSAGDYWTVTSNLRFSQIRYTDSIAALDSDEVLVAIGARRYLGALSGGSSGFTVLLGDSKAKQADSPFGRSIAGISTETLLLVKPGLQMVGGASYVVSDYDGLFTGVSRTDEQLSLRLALNLQRSSMLAWVFRPQIRFINNQSDIDLYQYDRFEAGFQIRRLFE